MNLILPKIKYLLYNMIIEISYLLNDIKSPRVLEAPEESSGALRNPEVSGNFEASVPHFPFLFLRQLSAE